MINKELLGPWPSSSLGPQPSLEPQTRGWCRWGLHQKEAQRGVWGTCPIRCPGISPRSLWKLRKGDLPLDSQVPGSEGTVGGLRGLLDQRERPHTERRPQWPGLSRSCRVTETRIRLQLVGQPPAPGAPEAPGAAGCRQVRRPPAARRGSGAPAGKPGREAAAAAAASPPAQARAPRSGPRKVADPARGLARRGGAGGSGPRPAEAGALRGSGRRAPRTPIARPRAPLTQLGDVGLSFRPRCGRFGRRLPRPACGPSRRQQLVITETTKPTWSPNSLKSTSSQQPLICIPEVAPRSPVRAPLSPLPPRSSPTGRCRRLAGGTGRRRGGVGGWLALCLLGKQQSPGRLQIFPARLSGLL